MPKYHISPVTGRPNMCYASVRSCPVGGEDAHYESKEEARSAYEKDMSDETFPTIKLSKPMKIGSKEYHQFRDREISKQIEENNKIKKAILANPDPNDWEGTMRRMSEVDAHGKRLKKEKLDNDSKLAEFPAEVPINNQSLDEKLREADPISYHNSKDRVKEVMEKGRGRTRPRPEEHFSINAGRLNPATLDGDGAQYFDRGKNSLVILAQADGSRPRAISSWGEFYGSPEDELGAPAVQIKQKGSWGADARTNNLHVVGYVNKQGESFGYVPAKKLHFFVYK